MAILFDMDGLLLDTERLACEAFEEVAGAIGQTDLMPFFLSLVGSSVDHTRTRLVEKLGAAVDIDQFDRDWDNAFDARIAAGAPIKAGVFSALQALAKKSVTMVVLTSTQTVRARHHLASAGLLPWFSGVIGGDMVDANKPDPAPYLIGAQLAGVDPADCFAFEDSDLGVQSAHADGCYVSQIPDLRPAGVPYPNLGQSVYPDLRSALEDTGWL